MAVPAAADGAQPASGRSRGPAAALAFVVVVCVLLAGASLLRSGPSRPVPNGGGVGAAPSVTAAATPLPIASTAALSSPVVIQDPQPAPPLSLTNQDGRHYSLANLLGQFALVFFGYTHCPDVCPDTIGKLESTLAAFRGPAQAVFVTVDPSRDTVAWLKEYLSYLPGSFTGLTGSEAAVRATADAWGVRYARVDTGDPSAYSMSHTADVFVVDPDGIVRARFPYGTSSAAMLTTLDSLRATQPRSSVSGASEAPTSGSALVLQPEVVSTSVWAGDGVPVILSISGPAGRLDDVSARVSVQLAAADGSSVGEPVDAVAVQPSGVTDVSWVATMKIPAPGAYRFDVTARTGQLPLKGSTGLVTALDQGATPPIGSAVPTTATPTMAPGGNDLRSLSTDPIPDRRLYQTSTADALAAHTPFVVVMDSTRFRVTSACGKALVMVKYLLDRWRDVAFIHHEPFRYEVELDTPVLQGTLDDPVLTDIATAWGLGSGPWSATSMPWIFVVDGSGTLRAKYQGVVGTDDVDVILSMLTAGS